MATQKTTSYKVDFYVVTIRQDRSQPHVRTLLEESGSLTPARSLSTDEDEKYQIRSIVWSKSKKVCRGVFGRCRYGEKPVQGDESGHEEDVELKPGHGLVHKNYFMYFSDRNLLVYQRNASGSHYARLQRYLALELGEQNLALEPILTKDSYQWLLNDDVNARKIELSFQQPKDPSLYRDMWFGDAVKLVNGVGGVSARINISMGRTGGALLPKFKRTAVLAARTGLAKVAKIHVEGDEDPVDLIVDRIVETITVPLGSNGRPSAEEIYAAMDNAVSSRRDELKAFFGS